MAVKKKTAKKTKTSKKTTAKTGVRKPKVGAEEREAMAAAKAAEQAAKKAQVEAKRAQQKAQAKLDKKAKDQANQKTLAPYAKEINARWVLAKKADEKADDHRLSAAIQAAEAKAFCTKNKVNFKDWCDANLVDIGYHAVRKLVPIGELGEEKGRLALEDLRSGQRKASAKHREKTATSKSAPKGKSGPDETALERIENAIDRAKNNTEKQGLARAAAEKAGLKVTSDADAKVLSGLKKGGIAGLKTIFKGQLSPKEQMEFLRWAAEEVGVEFEV